MNFTDAHKEILEKHLHHWHGLRDIGVMRNLDPQVFNELQQVHNEAIAVQHFSSWCSSCVAEMVRIIYTQYEKVATTEPVLVEEPPKRNNKKQKNGQQVSGQ